MSLYDEVKQGFYKDAINVIAKKVDELDEADSGGVTFTPEQIAYGDTDSGDSSASWNSGVTKFSFKFTHSFDYIVPVGIWCGTTTTDTYNCFANIREYTETAYNNIHYATVMCTYFNMLNDDSVIDEPVLYYIGVMKGE